MVVSWVIAGEVVEAKFWGDTCRRGEAIAGWPTTDGDLGEGYGRVEQ